MTPPPIGRAAMALGFAGLLPQVAAAGIVVFARDPVLVEAARPLAIFYGALILSFLGGIWWGFAIRRPTRQAPLLIAAIVPSLVAFALLIAAVFGLPGRWAAMAMGAAIIATLAVDRGLVGSGEAPAGWMRLRVPLSVGLGVLTMLAGVA